MSHRRRGATYPTLLLRVDFDSLIDIFGPHNIIIKYRKINNQENIF